MKEKKLKLEDFKVQSFVTTTAANTLGGQPIWSTPYTACNDTSGAVACYPSNPILCPEPIEFTLPYWVCTGNDW
jgi:hypothetical protein